MSETDIKTPAREHGIVLPDCQVRAMLNNCSTLYVVPALDADDDERLGAPANSYTIDQNSGTLTAYRMSMSTHGRFAPLQVGTKRLDMRVGDRVWVKEAFQSIHRMAYVPGRGSGVVVRDAVRYRATDDKVTGVYRPVWRPAAHMPRWASRIFATVTRVSLCRVRDLTLDEVMDAGFSKARQHVDTGAFIEFRLWWDKIYKDQPVSSNPLAILYRLDVHMSWRSTDSSPRVNGPEYPGLRATTIADLGCGE